MANNRMYLQCMACQECFYLAKYYPSTGWYTPDDPAGLGYKFSDFLEEHSPCRRPDDDFADWPEDKKWITHGERPDIDWGVGFRLCYEIDPGKQSLPPKQEEVSRG